MEDLSININDILSMTEKKPEPAKRKTEINTQDEFLLLLVNQLKNQNPLDPLSPEEFAVQLAQFASVERLLNIENALNIQAENSNQVTYAMNNTLAATLIGKSVRSLGNAITYEEGKDAVLQYELTQKADAVAALIKNRTGGIVQKYMIGSQNPGEHTIVWDGKDNEGNTVEGGIYSFEIIALDNEGNPIETNHYQIGEVEGVRYVPGDMPRVIINGREISLADVREIRKNIEEIL